MSKHTPGPWLVDGPKAMKIECRVHRVMNGERFPAAFVPAWDRPDPGEHDGTEEALANANLIAAAPELLASLTLCQSALAAMIAPDAIKGTSVLHAFALATEAESKARAAISKAGGQP